MISLYLAVLSSIGTSPQNSQRVALSPSQTSQLQRCLTQIDRPDLVSTVSDPKTVFTRDYSGEYSYRLVFNERANGVYGTIGVGFDRPTGLLITIDLSLESRETKLAQISDDVLQARATRLVNQLQPLADLRLWSPEKEGLSGERNRSNNTSWFTFYRYAHGYKTFEDCTAAFDRETGRVRFVGFELVLDVDSHGADPVMDTETLKSIALGVYSGAPGFEQGEIRERPIDLRLPQTQAPSADRESGTVATRLYSPARANLYRDLERGRVVIPVYTLAVASTEFPTEAYVVSLDARDGSLIGAEMLHGIGGTRGTVKPLPAHATANGIAGTLEPVDQTSYTPPGRPVTVASGTELYAARFEPGQSTLWLRRTKDEPYRAFRPDPGLRKALAAQIRRGEAVGEKR